ncbi:hypothetical protein ACET3Z_006380 [Daucus carota]
MVSAIPVPAAVKVSSHADIDYVPFRRPESYITCKDDDLTRVLGRGGAIYEMDCEDEEWLNKFNTEKGSEEPISADFFEMIISSFEKRLFCDQGNRLDVKTAVDHCISLGRRDVLRIVTRAEIGSMHRIRLVVIRRLFGKVKELWMLDMGLGTNKGNFEALSEDEYEDWL